MIPRAADASPPAPSRPHRPHASRRALVLAAALLCGWAAGHVTVVFGTLDVAPNPPPAGTPIVLELTLEDPAGAPVEDAVVHAELAPAEAASDVPTPETDALREGDGTPQAPPSDAAAAPVAEVRFSEASPGTYRAEVSVPSAGAYRVLLRDRTFPQEEATQTVSLTIGGDRPVERVEFLFPPTATGSGLAAWLLWLVAVPVVAGVIVTVLVLRGGSGDGARDAPPRDA